MKTLTISVISLIVAVTVCSAMWAWDQSHPLIAAMGESRNFCVDAVVGLDLTHSMKPEEQAVAKKIVYARIIPAIGPCDLFKVVEIGPQFTDISSIAGGAYEEQIPEPPEETYMVAHRILTHGTDEPPGIVSERMLDIARQMKFVWPVVRERHEKWRQTVMAASVPKDPGSSFSKFFEGTNEEFAAPNVRNKIRRVSYLIVVGDLHEQDRLGHSQLVRANGQFPADLRVLLVYPHDSEHRWNEILDEWRKYFRGASVVTLPFGSALDQKMLLPPNPLAQLQDVDTRGFWDYAKLALSFNAWFIAGSGLVLLLGYWFHHRRLESTTATT